jgi:hypothetical protein
MSLKMVKFSLKKSDAVFSEKQKQDIRMQVDYDRNWKNFKDLKAITFLSIDDSSFVVRVDDEGDSWHSNFARILNEKAILDNLCVVFPNDRQLFHVEEQPL